MTTPESAIREAQDYIAKAGVSLATAALAGEGPSPRLRAAMNALTEAMAALYVPEETP